MAKPKYDPTAALRMTVTQAPVITTTPAPETPDQAVVPEKKESRAQKSTETAKRDEENSQKTAEQMIRTTSEIAVSVAAPSATEEVKTPQQTAKQKPVAAKGTQTARPTYYLYPEDIAKIRQLSAYMQGQHGDRVNDSHIIRAALRMVTVGQPLVEAIRYVKSLDRRATSTDK